MGRRDFRPAFQICRPTMLQPYLDLFQVPHNASRREIEAAREVTAFLHFVDRTAGKRHVPRTKSRRSSCRIPTMW